MSISRATKIAKAGRHIADFKAAGGSLPKCVWSYPVPYAASFITRYFCKFITDTVVIDFLAVPEWVKVEH
jgi:hypothetical protein